MSKQQTAVEWLVEQIKSDQNQKALSASQWMQVIEQAKEMERNQIIDAWENGAQAEHRAKVNGKADSDSFHYYKETYEQLK